MKTNIHLPGRKGINAFMVLSFVSALLVCSSPAFVQATSPAEDARKVPGALPTLPI